MVAAYILINVIIVAVNPFSSKWHYHTQDPAPVRVMDPEDGELSRKRIVRILDEIDLAYGAREPTAYEKAKMRCMDGMSILFLPASIVQVMKDFVGYIGPANDKQQAFTVSVKRRYNHLAELAIEKGFRANRFLYQIEPSLSKRNGVPFVEVRGYGSGKSGQVDDGN